MAKVELQLMASSIIIITALSTQSTSAGDSDIINPNWVKPGWRRNNRYADVPDAVKECQCPAVLECTVESSTKLTPTEEENNRLALIFYRKFLISLFDESKLIVDEENTDFKLRNVQFKITEQQLMKLKEEHTAREIEAVLTSIDKQSATIPETLGWNSVFTALIAVVSIVFIFNCKWFGIFSPKTREQAVVPGDDLQAPQSPTASFNMSRPVNSRVEQTTNRIEEITGGGNEPNAETFRRKKHGSSDGPAVKNEATDEGESLDEEMIMIQRDLADDVRKNAAENSTDNQSKTRVDR